MLALWHMTCTILYQAHLRHFLSLAATNHRKRYENEKKKTVGAPGRAFAGNENGKNTFFVFFQFSMAWLVVVIVAVLASQLGRGGGREGGQEGSSNEKTKN